MNIFLFSLLISSQCFSISFKEWQKLSNEQKIDHVESNLGDAFVSVNERKLLSTKLSPTRQKTLKKKIDALTVKLSSLEAEFDTDVQDDIYSIVGSLVTTADLYFSSDNKFLAAQINYRQAGCSQMNSEGEFLEESGYYANATEAEQNLCHDNDVSWSGYSIINEDFKTINSSEYMEWSGH